MKVWLLTRAFDNPAGGGSDQIIGVFSTEEKAEAAMDAEPNPEPWYGTLEISEWPVDD